jgi:hypothetical protein
MVERFYSISHLSTAQLRDLYTTYRKLGKTDSEYFIQNPAADYPPELPEAEIILNIDADDEHNYFVFMLDHEHEDDGILISFSMSYLDDVALFLHLPPELLDEIVEKYALHNFSETEETTWEKILSQERLKYSLN